MSSRLSYRLLSVAAIAMALSTVPARAALNPGAGAPEFAPPASRGGTERDYRLGEARSQGPVVLYFYPAAFTKGCTIEAHEFAEAVPQFKALGATVIGVSMDPIATLDRFSVSECRSAFAVAADPDGHITRSYDALMPGGTHADRVSYVIAPDGHVAMTYAARSPEEHVSRALAAVRALKTPASAP